MTSFFGAVLLVGGVIALIKVFGLFPRALQAVRTSRSAFDVMNDPELADDRKESLLQGVQPIASKIVPGSFDPRRRIDRYTRRDCCGLWNSPASCRSRRYWISRFPGRFCSAAP